MGHNQTPYPGQSSGEPRRSQPPAGPDFAQPSAPRPPTPEPQLPPPSPWPPRIAGGVIVVSILAILLGIFLPRERPVVTPQAGPPAPRPTPTVQPQRQTVARAATVQRASPAPRRPVRTEARKPGALFSPSEARAAVLQAEDAERIARDQVLQLMITELRKPQYQNVENYAILCVAMQTAGLAMIPGGPKEGHLEVITVITSARTGSEAAQRLEAMGHEPAFTLAVENALIRVLANATGYQDILAGIQSVQAETGVTLSPQAIERMKRIAADAARRQGKPAPAPAPASSRPAW